MIIGTGLRLQFRLRHVGRGRLVWRLEKLHVLAWSQSEAAGAAERLAAGSGAPFYPLVFPDTEPGEEQLPPHIEIYPQPSLIGHRPGCHSGLNNRPGAGGIDLPLALHQQSAAETLQTVPNRHVVRGACEQHLGNSNTLHAPVSEVHMAAVTAHELALLMAERETC
jgi:hypothetical protein